MASITTTAFVLLCGYLLIGLTIAVGFDAMFKLSFSLKETAVLAVAWPYYILPVLRDAPAVHWLLTILTPPTRKGARPTPPEKSQRPQDLP